MASFTENSESYEVLTGILQSIEELSSCTNSHQHSINNIGNSWNKPSPELNTALTVLHAAAGSIHSSATKFGLLAKASPKKNEIQSLCDEMVDFCDKLSSALRVASLSGAAEPLAKILQCKVKSILHAVSDLVSTALSGRRNAKGEVGLAPAAGVVWSACDDLQRAPKSNRDAYRWAFLTWSVGIKDTVDEFHDLVEKSKTSPRDLTDEPRVSEERARFQEMDNEAFFEEMDDLDDDCYTVEECSCAEAIVDLIRMSRRSLKFAMDVTKSGTERTEDQLAWVDQLYQNGKDIVDLAINLGMSLYPPLSTEELEICKTAYMGCLDAIIRQLSSAEFVTETERDEIQRLHQRFTTRHDQANAALHAISNSSIFTS